MHYTSFVLQGHQRGEPPKAAAFALGPGATVMRTPLAGEGQHSACQDSSRLWPVISKARCVGCRPLGSAHSCLLRALPWRAAWLLFTLLSSKIATYDSDQCSRARGECGGSTGRGLPAHNSFLLSLLQLSLPLGL